MGEEKSRRSAIGLGELIAIAALLVSAVGVWIAWKSSNEDKPTRVLEQRQPVPLTLRAKVEDDGRKLVISPVEGAHALDSLKITIAGGSTITVGSDGELSAGDLEGALPARDGAAKERTLSVAARIAARYVEAGKDRRATGNYVLRYRWEGGGLFGGKSVRLVSLSRS